MPGALLRSRRPPPLSSWVWLSDQRESLNPAGALQRFSLQLAPGTSSRRSDRSVGSRVRVRRLVRW